MLEQVPLTLTHGDFHEGNIVLADDSNPTTSGIAGVLDWSSARWNTGLVKSECWRETLYQEASLLTQSCFLVNEMLNARVVVSKQLLCVYRIYLDIFNPGNVYPQEFKADCFIFHLICGEKVLIKRNLRFVL